MRTALALVILILLLAAGGYVAWTWWGTGHEKAVSAPIADEPGPADPNAQPSDDLDPTTVPSFDVVRISREGTGVIAGRAAPGATVDILADGQVIGTEIANTAGEWVLVFEAPLPPGEVELSLRARADGGAEAISSDIVVLAIPERDDMNTGVIAVLTPRDGKGASRVLQVPENFRLGGDLSVESVDFDDSGNAFLSGRGTPGQKVRIYLNNEYLGEVRPDEDGRWSLQTDRVTSASRQVIRLDQILEGDNVDLRIEQPFNPSAPIDPSLAEGSVSVRKGNSLWLIARRIYGSGFLYTTIFRANDAQIRDPDLIYPGQRFVLPREADTQ